jgi:hypothetical protein
MKRWIPLLVVLIFAGASRIAAQASIYLPLDDVAYHYIDALMARGHLRSLPVLERPYTVRAVRAALDSARSGTLSQRLTEYADRLAAAMDKYEPRSVSDEASKASGVVSTELYAAAASSTRRELMVATMKNFAKPGVAGRATFVTGAFGASLRLIADNRLNVDPEFAGRKDRAIEGRTEDAYVNGQWRYAELFIGRLGRNWGPYPLDGLMLGHYAYTYDHAALSFGIPQVKISLVATKLDDIAQEDGIRNRYFSIHRISARLGSVELAASEAYLYQGIHRTYELAALNPLNVYALSWRNENVDGNLSFGAEGSWRSRWGTVGAQVLIDDVQVDDTGLLDEEPPAYGLSFTAEGLPIKGDQRLFASYTRVANLTYRTPNAPERYTSFDVGLGRGFSDYDELRVGWDAALIPYVPLRLYVARRRQGEGDYRIPFPDPSLYNVTPTIFSGVVTRTTRIGLSGGAEVPGSIEVKGDIGHNLTVNEEHVHSPTRSRFVASVRFAWVWRAAALKLNN